MRTLGHDVRHALRVFARAPFFHSAVLLTLALGIGANAAVFSILRAVLLQPLPYRDADRVVMMWRSKQLPPAGQQNGMLQGRAWTRGFLTTEMVRDWREASKDVLSDVAAIVPATAEVDAQFDLVRRDRTERLRGALATPNFFDLLGATASRGRVFTADDERSPQSLAVLSDALWRREFGADPAIVGRAVTLVGGWRPRTPIAFTVVGVLPPAFRFTYPDETQVWAMESWAAFGRVRRGICCQAIARVKPGVTFETASARMAAMQIDMSPSWRESIRLERVYDWIVGETRPSLLLLGAVALLLLVTTCATTANALLVRIAERRRELAVRASLGADRRRLLQQLLVEGAVLSTAGAAAGTLAAVVIAPVLRAWMPAVVPRGDQIGVSAWTLLFGIGVAVITTVVAAAAPAWHGARADPAPALKSGAANASGDRVTVRWRHAMVGMQVAMATILLVSAALLLVSFWRLGRVPLGFDGSRVLTVEMRLDGPRYVGTRGSDGKYKPAEAIDTFRRDLLERVRAVPGVVDAGITSAVPFRGTDFTTVLKGLGRAKEVVGNTRMVDAGYFSVMRIPLVRGRLFTPADTVTSPKVAVISEAYARQMFGDDDPLGKQVDYDGATEVVGVVGDVRYVALDRGPQPAIYLPAVQASSLLVCLVARLARGVADPGAAVRAAVHDIDPGVPAMKMTTVDQIVNESIANRRFYTTATAAFAALALALTLIGLVVIVARSVVERRRELAIRSALGATSPHIVRLVVGQGLMPVIAGISGGLTGAFFGAGALAQFLFGVTPHAPAIYLSATVLTLSVAAAAILVPARRAARVEPARVLRAD